MSSQDDRLAVEVGAVLAQAWAPSPPPEELEALVALFVEALRGGRAEWPEVDVPAATFVAHLVSKLPSGRPVPEALLALHLGELYLACACARGDAGALALFDETFGAELRLVARRRGAVRIDVEDFVQVARQKLFTGERPRIADYGGLGELRGWLRVVLTRTLIDLLRARGGLEIPSGDAQQLVALPAPGDDPELDYLKRLYQGQFRQAFEDAAATLEPEDRNILRQHFVHGLSIDELGRLHGVHRATAARRLAHARDELLGGTRRRLMERLALTRGALDSVMRMIQSGVQLSVRRVLGADAEAG